MSVWKALRCVHDPFGTRQRSSFKLTVLERNERAAGDFLRYTLKNLNDKRITTQHAEDRSYWSDYGFHSIHIVVRAGNSHSP